MFHKFKEEFQKNFATLLAFSERRLYRTGITGETLWLTYLSSFPTALQQEYNCNACKQFIRHYGGLVGLTAGGRKTIWDVDASEEFAMVADRMNTLVLNAPVVDLFVTDIVNLGTDKNLVHTKQANDIDTVKTWEHLFIKLPKEMRADTRVKSIEALMGEARDNRNVFKRGLDEIAPEAVDTVLELIASNSLYRGSEYQAILNKFKELQELYHDIADQHKADWAWRFAPQHAGAVAQIRNTAIGTLLVDISKGEELDIAVRSFERIMAPTNYKRPNAIITNKMIEQAEKTIADLGYGSALGRRFAIPDDIKVSDLLFVDRDLKKETGALASLKKSEVINPKTLSRLQDMAYGQFINAVLPTAKSMEILFEPRHIPNLVSLIAPVDPTAKGLFKWPNGFSWSYKDALTDSIKQKVKAAGGNIEGEIRVSLAWHNHDDLDLHIIEPSQFEIDFRRRLSPTGGNLDVDMNAGGNMSEKPVENIVWPIGTRPLEGEYHVVVNQYNRRETIDSTFEVQIECQGQLYEFSGKNPAQGNCKICDFAYTRKGGIEITMGGHLGAAAQRVNSKTVWGVDTNKFHPVSMVMKSPNHWGLAGHGNMHYFFIMDKVHNDEVARGFFNEFLDPELEKHKRVFEALGSRMAVAPADRQVSGLGFSVTKPDDLIVRVNGHTDRTFRIKF